MTTFRSIEETFKGAPVNMVGDGFRVSNYFPSGNNLGQRLSPFILLDYNAPHQFPASSTPKGVGPHPHKGFETVTIAYEGSIEHHDNKGSHGVINPGDIQWMTAGSGLMHKEYHEKSFSERGGVLHMIQLWVNLPREEKNHPPRYQTLLDKQMSRVSLPENGGTIRVIAGELDGIEGPAQTFSPINMFDITFKEHGKAHLALPSTFNTAALVLRGKIKINETQDATERDFVLFENEPEDILIEGITENAMVIVLSGEPLDEPVVQYGPFVMNTEEEIQQAFRDFQLGKFGNPDF